MKKISILSIASLCLLISSCANSQKPGSTMEKTTTKTEKVEQMWFEQDKVESLLSGTGLVFPATQKSVLEAVSKVEGDLPTMDAKLLKSIPNKTFMSMADILSSVKK